MGSAASLPWCVLHVPKRGCTAEEYEDAWAADPAAGAFAVADGASESSYSGLWAQLLTAAFVAAEDPFAEGMPWLAEPRQNWSATVDALDLSWYAEMKRAQGAHATFLGLSLQMPTAAEPGCWRALAVGDSCLIRLRRGFLPRSFPLENSADFGNQPRLLCSRTPVGSPPDRPAESHFEQERGSCLPGDRLFLMTDALAQWFLLRCEQGERPWKSLIPVFTDSVPESAFVVWVEERRDRQELRNDDVTLLSVGPIPPLSTTESSS
jgi:hypothetical protein